jgi:hypothetical protein
MSVTIDETYPARLNIDFPDRALDRVATFLRLIYALPVVILLSIIGGAAFGDAGEGGRMGAVAGGVLVLPVLLMVLFRQKYPRWWFDFNLQLTRFSTRVMSYLALMSDRYPSTDEEQSVHLDLDYPDVKQELNRWLPLVKWFLAIPHYVVLLFLGVAAFFAVIFAFRDPFHREVSPGNIRVRRRGFSLEPSSKRLCLPTGDGPLSAIPAGFVMQEFESSVSSSLFGVLMFLTTMRAACRQGEGCP